MPLTDDEANQEMKKMVAFIMQEAAEKAREIQVKADEEFNIEKAKLVRQETASIEGQFERRLKQAQVRRKIAQSGQINKTRLQVLQAREQVLQDIYEKTRKIILSRIEGNDNNSAMYGGLLERLTLQGLYRLMEKDVVVKCRKVDFDLVQEAIIRAKNEFEREARIQIAIRIDQTNWLNPDSLGGVVVSSMKGKIRIDNTLDARLEQSSEKLMPTVRTIVFGPPESRRFFD